jgi:phage gpG-like protein
MVDDRNNFDEARDAIDEGLDQGLAELHSEVLEAVESNMTDGKDALGNKWVPVTPETLFSSREVRTSNRDALVDTGEYRADIVATSAEAIDLNERVALIGTTKEFGPAHEFGAPELGIPRRPLFAPAARFAEQRAPEILGEEVELRLDNAEL